MVFHLHKNRNFLRKIERQKQETDAKIENEIKLRHLISTNQAMIDEARALKRGNLSTRRNSPKVSRNNSRDESGAHIGTEQIEELMNQTSDDNMPS